MKHILLTCLGLLFGLGLQAQSYDYLTLRTLNGDETSLGIDNLRITFADGKLNADNGRESASVPLADMSCMFFSLQPTGIGSQAGLTDASLQVRIVGGRLITNAPAGSSIRVYGVDGRQVSTARLAAGTYIVNINGRTFKLLAK